MEDPIRMDDLGPISGIKAPKRFSVQLDQRIPELKMSESRMKAGS